MYKNVPGSCRAIRFQCGNTGCKDANDLLNIRELLRRRKGVGIPRDIAPSQEAFFGRPDPSSFLRVSCVRLLEVERVSEACLNWSFSVWRVWRKKNLAHYHFVHKFLPMPQAMKLLEARAAVEK